LGLPPTAGFWGKASLLLAGFSPGPYLEMRRAFAVLAVVCTLVQATAVYRFWCAGQDDACDEESPVASVATRLLAAAVLGLGLWPAPMLIGATELEQSLLGP
jgi:formate hydrogenlyase subunit 3/multisubunit Na+/H+ antiporter MnhD subunit